MQGQVAAIIAIQSVGLALGVLLLATSWIGRVHRHLLIIVFWLLVLAATINSLVAHIVIKAGGFPTAAQCLVQAILSQYFWTALSMFMLSFTLELTRLVYNALKAEEKPARSQAWDVYLAAALSVLPFFLAGPTLGTAIFVAPWADASIEFKKAYVFDSSTVRITQASTLTAVFVGCIVAVVWAGQLVLKIHSQTNHSITIDIDTSFTLRMAYLELLSAGGAGLTICFNLIRARPDIAFVWDIYIVSLPILASLVFIGSDTLKVWRRWCGFGMRRSRHQTKVSIVTIGGSGSSKLSKKSGGKRTSGESEFASRMSDMPEEWLAAHSGSGQGIEVMRWRDSRRSSIAAFAFFGAPELPAAHKSYIGAHAPHTAAQSFTEDQHAIEVVDMTLLNDPESVSSPRRRHHPNRSRDKLVIPRNFMSISPDPTATGSRYSASEYSFAGTHRETRFPGPLSPASPRAAFHDDEKARRTPSPKQSPNVMSFHPALSRSGTVSSGMHTIKPLRIQNGMSIFDLYARDRDSRAQKPAKSYGWI